MLRNRIVYSPPDDNAGGVTPPTTPPTETPDPHVATRELTNAINQLIPLVRDMNSRSVQPPTAPVPDDDDAVDDVPDENLELMSRSDFGRHIVDKVLKAVNAQVVKPLNQQLGSIRADTSYTQIQAAVTELRKTYKDYDDWIPEMTAVAQANGGRLDPLSVYHLAKAFNPTKEADLKKRYAPAAETPQVGPVRLKGFGGLTPGQSGTGNTSRKMSARESSSKAWDEMVAAIGGEPEFGPESDED